MTGTQVRVCDPVIFTSLSTCSRWREECPLGLPHGGGGQLHTLSPLDRGEGGDIRWRGEAAAAQIDFYHDTLTIVN